MNFGPKKRKNTDPAWRPEASSIKRVKPSTKVLLNLMGACASPDPKFTAVHQTMTPSKSVHASSALIFSSPDRGVNTSFVTTPLGSRLLPTRIVECDDLTIGFFGSEKKSASKEWVVPPIPAATIAQSPVPAASLQGIIDYKITSAMINNIPVTRSSSQKDVTKIPASNALALAGVSIENGDAHWLHLIFHLGKESQTVANLVIGTKYCNAAMELINPVIKEVIKKEKLDALYLSVIPEFVAGYEKIRLAKSITMIIKDKPGKDCTRSVKITFNALSLTPVCESEIDPMKAIIMQKFAGYANKENAEAAAKKLKL